MCKNERFQQNIIATNKQGVERSGATMKTLTNYMAFERQQSIKVQHSGVITNVYKMMKEYSIFAVILIYFPVKSKHKLSSSNVPTFFFYYYIFMDFDHKKSIYFKKCLTSLIFH